MASPQLQVSGEFLPSSKNTSQHQYLQSSSARSLEQYKVYRPLGEERPPQLPPKGTKQPKGQRIQEHSPFPPNQPSKPSSQNTSRSINSSTVQFPHSHKWPGLKKSERAHKPLSDHTLNHKSSNPTDLLSLRRLDHPQNS